MSRFVLIDHSISDLAGHHYEYAQHVLRAAARAGYDPVLVTNRQFILQKLVPWPVLPIYEFGFWPEPKASAVLRLAAAAWARLSRAQFLCRCRTRYSHVNLAWLCRFKWGEYVRKRPSAGELPYHLFGILLILILKLARTAVLVLLLPAFLIAAAAWVIWATAKLFFTSLCKTSQKGPATARQYCHAVATEAKTYADFVKMAWAAVTARVVRTVKSRIAADSDDRQMGAFARDTGELLTRVNPESGDIFFIPTISERDMIGLARVFEVVPAASRPSWHLLFRRNIFSGRTAEYACQDDAVTPLRSAFEEFRCRSGNARVVFYTDTEDLTAQYNRLGVYSFRTLPIPHTYSPQDRIPHEGPLRLTYLGDARREKGFHYLPQLAADLRYTGRSPEVRFVVQCNYNIPGGEPEAAVARSQLEGITGAVLFKEPLTSEQYRELLLLSDINLLFYDATNYYARSSGILVESLAVGIPVLVPAGSWLARQFLKPYSAHQERLWEHMKVQRRYTQSSLTWYRHGHPTQRADSAEGILARAGSKAYCWLDVPAGSTHLVLQLSPEPGIDEALVQICELDGEDYAHEARTAVLETNAEVHRATQLFRLREGTGKIWFALSGTHASLQVRFQNVEISFLREQDRQPTGAVGLIYQSADEIAELTRELIAFYPHYRATALEFAEKWRHYHNSDRLLAELAEGAGERSGNTAVFQAGVR